MTKAEFLARLTAALSQLPEAERERQRAYYAEMLDDMTEDGLAEAEAVEKLGSPEEAAEKVLREMPLPELVRARVRPAGGWTALSIVLLILGFPLWGSLMLAFLAVLAAVYLTIWAAVAALFAAVAAVALSGAAIVVGALVHLSGGVAALLLAAGTGLVLAGLGVAAFFPALWAARGLVKLTGALGRWVRSLFLRKETV